MKLGIAVSAFFVFVACAHPAFAQGFGGCVDSPENPTLILAGLATGGYAVNQLRRRLQLSRRGAERSAGSLNQLS